MKMEDIVDIPQFSSDWWIELWRCKVRVDEALVKINQMFWSKLMKNYTPALSDIQKVIGRFRDATDPVFQWITNGFDLRLESISEDDKVAFFACMKNATNFFGNGKGEMETRVIPAMENDILFTPAEQQELQEKMKIARDGLAQIFWMMF